MIDGKFKSRKNKKRASKSRRQGGARGRLYLKPMQISATGDRYIEHGARKVLLSRGPRQFS